MTPTSYIQLYDANLSLCTCELREFDFEPCNADKKVSSLDQFLSYMNKEIIFDSFPGIENVIVSDVLRTVSYLHSRDIIHRDRKPANVLASNSNSHYKSYKHEEAKMAFGKKTIACKLGDLREARSMYTQTNYYSLHELSIASAGTDELKTVDVWVVSMTFFTILNPDQSYPFQHNLKNTPNEVTSNTKAPCPQ